MAFKKFERASLELSMGTMLSCLCASNTYADTLTCNSCYCRSMCCIASNADRLACYDSMFKALG
jgi:phospholipase A1